MVICLATTRKEIKDASFVDFYQFVCEIFKSISHHDCHHSDFEEEIRPAGLPRKRYLSRKPRATMGEDLFHLTPIFEEEPEEQ